MPYIFFRGWLLRVIKACYLGCTFKGYASDIFGSQSLLINLSHLRTICGGVWCGLIVVVCWVESWWNGPDTHSVYIYDHICASMWKRKRSNENSSTQKYCLHSQYVLYLYLTETECRFCCEVADVFLQRVLDTRICRKLFCCYIVNAVPSVTGTQPTIRPTVIKLFVSKLTKDWKPNADRGLF